MKTFSEKQFSVNWQLQHALWLLLVNNKFTFLSLSPIPSAVGSQKDILAALKAITSKSTVHRGEEKVM